MEEDPAWRVTRAIMLPEEFDRFTGVQHHRAMNRPRRPSALIIRPAGTSVG